MALEQRCRAAVVESEARGGSGSGRSVTRNAFGNGAVPDFRDGIKVPPCEGNESKVVGSCPTGVQELYDKTQPGLSLAPWRCRASSTFLNLRTKAYHTRTALHIQGDADTTVIPERARNIPYDGRAFGISVYACTTRVLSIYCVAVILEL